VRGVLSFLYAFAAIASILFVYSYYSSLSGVADINDHRMLVLEDRYAREMELKRAITDTIRHSVNNTLSLNPNSGDDEIKENLGRDLSQLRGLEGAAGYRNYSYYDIFRRFVIRFWCGNPSDDELERIARTHEWVGRGDYICDGCNHLDKEFEYVELDASGNIVGGGKKNLCSQFFSVDRSSGTVSVSIAAPEMARQIAQGRFQVSAEMQGLLLSNDIKFGVMVYDSAENISSAAVIPISTEIRWSK